MADIIYTVDVALSEVPVNIMPMIGTDGLTIDTGVVYNEAGMDLQWNFVTIAGAFTQTAITPTDTGGAHDWVNQGHGHYTIEIPDTGGTINNDTEGFGWFSGAATALLPFRSPVFAFVKANVSNSLIAGSDMLDVNVEKINEESVSGDGGETAGWGPTA